ncbi:eCIS core domain-containing protein [Streptomyces sp. BBFR102]|uniref:eCIS core domain-containing protein n=1 Tax=Streptomyces sp. BBFR102 TaxID=3448171 RepID=UPI003F532948
MRMQESGKTPDERRPGRPARTARRVTSARTPAAAHLSSAEVLALQRSVGNGAVVQMLRQSGQLGAQAPEQQHQHDGGCGHRQADAAAPVQRSAVPEVLRSGGRPLDEDTRTDMEGRLGADFSDVRVHDDGAAKASAAEIGARAYTSGSHVVLGDGGNDRHTLAHELTHVIQQRQGPVAGTDNGSGLRVSDPSDRFERAAEANATRALAAPLDTQRATAASGTAAHGPAHRAPEQQQAIQRMPPKRNAAEAEANDGPEGAPKRGRVTRGSSKTFDLDKPKLRFTSAYDGPKTQDLHGDQSIGFSQAATLHNPDGAPQRVSTNYVFWQQVQDENVQITPSDPDGTPSHRDWQQDGPYRPNYTNAVITDSQNSITFNDDPGFSTTGRMSDGYWLKSYTVRFRWKVARNTGQRFDSNAPAWTSDVVTHTLTSDLDPANPTAPIRHRAAGDRTWDVDLS